MFYFIGSCIIYVCVSDFTEQTTSALAICAIPVSYTHLKPATKKLGKKLCIRENTLMEIKEKQIQIKWNGSSKKRNKEWRNKQERKGKIIYN